MKVSCERIINPITRAETEHSPWLVHGGVYVVLCVDAGPGDGVSLRILLVDCTPSIWDARLFSNRLAYHPVELGRPRRRRRTPPPRSLSLAAAGILGGFLQLRT